MHVDAEDYRSAGLYDPNAADEAEVLRLLEWLTQHGVSVAQMQRSNAVGALWSAAGDAAVRPGQPLSRAELSTQTGMAGDLVDQILLAAGATPPPGEETTFTAADIATFAMFQAGAEMFGPEPILEYTRVIGTSMARLAEASITLFQANIEGPLNDTVPDAIEFAETNLAGVQALALIPQAMEGLFRLHVELAIRRSREAHDVVSPIHSRRMAVGFVDLVGFTPLTRHLSDVELGDLIERFERQANDLVTRHDGRVVKHIGDEVMFVAVSAAAACRIATGLVEAFRTADHQVTPHGGVASGSLFTRGGDYYGPIVNLASRVASIAIPNEILVTAEVAAEVAPDLVFEPAGHRMLKGFDEPISLWSVAAPEPAAPAQ